MCSRLIKRTLVVKTKNNILIVIMLLIFAGQITASAVVLCPMQSSSSDMTMDHSAHSMDDSAIDDQVMDHTSHNMDNASPMSGSCCVDNAGCSMAGCFFFTLQATLQLQSQEFEPQVAFSDYPMAISQINSSLYRPPIFS